MSRSSAANQIPRELYEDIRYERMTRYWLQSAQVSTLTVVQLMMQKNWTRPIWWTGWLCIEWPENNDSMKKCPNSMIPDSWLQIKPLLIGFSNNSTKTLNTTFEATHCLPIQGRVSLGPAVSTLRIRDGKKNQFETDEYEWFDDSKSSDLRNHCWTKLGVGCWSMVTNRQSLPESPLQLPVRVADIYVTGQSNQSRFEPMAI